ncbi:sensor histidine kinase [Terrihabitans rhizophilus]|uniref:histidine kinase n=1 Tax=Terrihabitans rhizophilus TaxID=3092662 RepID=A0ABU4RRH1_9HYPH|nr:CHASE3 domain-containing protein [Terrihabitans sp. PJ23]MDX6806763.1 CHASE3 domain-containing protein [Terrihabitans sp. PJ23]
MPISNVRFIRATAILMLIGVAALLMMIGVTFWLSLKMEGLGKDIEEARRFNRVSIELRNALQDMETGQRGFLLTQEDAYLVPFEAARTRLPAILGDLGEDVFADHRAETARLREIAEGKLAELSRTIDMVRAGDLQGALEVVRTDQGKNLMQEARGIISGLLAVGDRRLSEATGQQVSSTRALQASIIGGTLLILIVVGISTVIALRYTRELLLTRAEMRMLNESLESRVAERTAELGRATTEIQRFAYIVGHDLRSPLVNVMGFTSELMEFSKEVFRDMDALRERTGIAATPADVQLQKDFDEAVGFIRTSTSKMDGLINAILKLSREGRRPLTPERIDMAALLEDASVNVRHRVNERGGSIAMSGTFPAIVSDKFSLEQVFGNLFDNAVKYSDPARAPEIKVVSGTLGADVSIDITDNGRGIAEGDFERIFELFRRTGRQDQPGEGIGLAYVRAYVRRLGGDITVTSKLGEGSTFRVRLPRTLKDATLEA